MPARSSAGSNIRRSEGDVARIWAGIGAGKTHHHCVVLDETGKRLLSRRVLNDEPEIHGLPAQVRGLGEASTWAIDLADGPAALVIAVLLEAGQDLLYIPGRMVNRAAGGYRGEGKTDARDAAETPAAIRRIGVSRLTAWLRRRGVYKADALAQAAVEAASRQRTALPGETLAAQLVATLAEQVLDLISQVAQLDRQIAARFAEHRQAKVIVSLPGMGPLLGAEFLAATGGDMP